MTPGTDAEVVVLREGVRLSLRIIIGTLSEHVLLAGSYSSKILGLTVENLTEDLALQQGYHGSMSKEE